MAGHIEKRGDKTWRVHVYLGTDPDTGKEIRHKHTVHGTKRDAEKYMTGCLRERDLGRFLDPDDMTVNSFLDKWLAMQKTRVKPRTYVEYEGTIERHVRRHIGKLFVSRVTTVVIQEMYAALGKHVAKTKKGKARPMGAPGIRKVHAVLRAAMESAVAWRLRTDNPARYAKPPKLEQKERAPVTTEMARAFVGAARGAERGALYLLALATGMRPQEYLALQWDDLDWDARRLTVARVLNRHKGGGWFLDSPKTPRSKRTIILPIDLMPLLREHQMRQEEARRRAGAHWQDRGFIFCTELGEPLHRINLAARDFRRIRDAARLPDWIRPYDLRHGCATLLLESGEDLKNIADQLGHSSIRLTADTYSHVTTGMKERTASKMNEAMFGAVHNAAADSMATDAR